MKILYTLLLLCLPAAHSLPPLAGPPGQYQEEGQVVSLRLRGVDGKTYDAGEMRGDVLLVSFGATWCLPCKAELAAVEELKREYAGKPVRFLWVSIEGEADITDKQLRAYAKEQKSSLPVLRDPARVAYEQFAALVPSPLKQSVKTPVPLLVFVDSAGKVSPPGKLGMTTPEAYKAFVRERLNGLVGAGAVAVHAGAR